MRHHRWRKKPFRPGIEGLLQFLLGRSANVLNQGGVFNHCNHVLAMAPKALFAGCVGAPSFKRTHQNATDCNVSFAGEACHLISHTFEEKIDWHAFQASLPEADFWVDIQLNSCCQGFSLKKDGPEIQRCQGLGLYHRSRCALQRTLAWKVALARFFLGGKFGDAFA